MGVDGGAGEGDEPFTPPQPMDRARTRGLKRNRKSRLNELTPHLISLGPDLIFETNHPSEVGLTMQGFLTMRFNPLVLGT